MSFESISGGSFRPAQRSVNQQSVGAPPAAVQPAPIPTPRPSVGRVDLNRDGFDGAPTKESAVRDIQARLGMSGVDGIFGPKTQAAVQRFQRERGLAVDGVVGPQTWGALFNQRLPGAFGMFGPGSRDEASPTGGAAAVGEPSRAGGLRSGGGWGGTERLADPAKRIAAQMGIPVTSEKRSKTGSIGSTSRSDHHVSQKNAYAVDFGVAGARGSQLARRLADAYGIKGPVEGSYQRHLITVDGQQYRAQLLWKVKGHYDHVHLGLRKV